MDVAKSMKMSEALFSTAYCAPVSYYACMLRFDKVWIEQHERYVKQTYRNRCVISAANGSMALTIPVEKPAFGKTGIRDIRISDHGDWRHVHWNAIVSAYRTSAYFDDYQEELRPFFSENKYHFLFDLNEDLRQLFCEWIGMPAQVSYTEQAKAQDPKMEDFREIIHPKKDFREIPFYRPQSYWQVFEQKTGFLPEMSILDLVFNTGPESILVLKQSLSFE